MDGLFADFRYAARTFMRRPAFLGIVVLTLALGIGSNTAIFSFVNAFLLRPLPYVEANRVTALYEVDQRTAKPSDDLDTIGVSYADYVDWTRFNSAFEGLSVFVGQSVNLTGIDHPDRIRGGFVNANFFSILKTNAAIGRTFRPNEDRAGSHVVVLQQELWKNRFGSDPLIIGKKLILNGEPFEVIGVMPNNFEFPLDEIEAWMPAESYPGFTVDRSIRNFIVLGRLKTGISLSTAQSQMSAVARRLDEQYPNQNKGIGVEVARLQDAVVRDARPALLILFGAVGFILLIGCANIANLMLSLNISRQKEFGIKAAIGASRLRLLRQMLIESLLLGAIGGMAGLLIGSWGTDLLLKMSPPLPGGIEVRLDFAVLLFSFLLSILSAIIFGLTPGLRLSLKRVFSFLREGGDSVSSAQGRTSRMLVVAQISLSLVLLVGSGLLIKSFWQLIQTRPGIRSENLLTMEYRLPKNKYPKEDQQLRFHQQVIEQIKQVQGVTAAAIVRGLPFSGNGSTIPFELTDRALSSGKTNLNTQFNTASPEYFRTIGIPLLNGRTFGDQDRADTPIVVVVNEKFANEFWPHQSPMGKQIRFPSENVTATVIGVVGNAKQYRLSEEYQPQIYMSLSQNPGIFATIVVRTFVEPMSLAEQVKAAVWKVDKDQPMWKVRTVDFLLKRDVSVRRFILNLLLMFAGLALLLTIIGLYGVVSHFVKRRFRDIGIRLALGAQKRNVLGMVIHQGIALTAIGILIGVAGVISITRIMTSLLYQVKPSDPITIVSGVVLLIIVSLLTILIPAYRATKIDPIKALHYEG